MRLRTAFLLIVCLSAAQAPVFAEDGGGQECLPPSLDGKVPLLKAVIVEQQAPAPDKADQNQNSAKVQPVIELPKFNLPPRSKSSQRPRPAAPQLKSAGAGSAQSAALQRAAQIKEMKSALQKYEHAGDAGHHRPAMPQVTAARPLQFAGSVQESQSQRADQIKQMTAMLQQYQHAGDRGYHAPHMLSLAPPVLQPPPAAVPVRLQASTSVNSQSPKSAQKSPAKLPRWGDKDCLCHAGLRLFQQKRYLEAADAYRQAGDNMQKAWGRQTNDVANAVRGEGICYSAAGRGQEAKVFLRSAAEMYIRCSNGHPPAELEATILDLSQTYRNIGALSTSNALQADVAKICTLSRVNPPQAIAELNRIACY